MMFGWWFLAKKLRKSEISWKCVSVRKYMRWKKRRRREQARVLFLFKTMPKNMSRNHGLEPEFSRSHFLRAEKTGPKVTFWTLCFQCNCCRKENETSENMGWSHVLLSPRFLAVIFYRNLGTLWKLHTLPQLFKIVFYITFLSR